MMNKIEMPDCHTKLLPCPFCGNDVHITKRALWHQHLDGSYHGYKDCYEFEVVCDRCGTHPKYTKNDTIYRSEEEAVTHVVNTWNQRVQDSLLESPFSNTEESKDESQCDWALIYEYARSMEDYLNDLDEVNLQACIERIQELAIEHGGDRIDQDQFISYLKKLKNPAIDDDQYIENIRDGIESCVKIIEESDWFLERTMDIEKREKLHLIALEATKVLRKLVNTP